MSPNRQQDLWARVAVGAPGECWPFTGACATNGYGRFWIGGKPYGAHRIAFELATGIAPGDLLVCHSCDNPPCCNPAHLFLGTAEENSHDARDKGRLVKALGERHGMARLTAEDVRAIRERRAAGESGASLSRAFDIDPSQITRIVKRKAWAHV